MPVSIQDASVLLAGAIFKLDLKTQFVNGERTNTPDGARVTVAADDGFSVVTIKQADLARLAPVVGDRIVWFVRPSLWEIDGSRVFGTAFVRLVDFGDVDALQSSLSVLSAAPSGTK